MTTLFIFLLSWSSFLFWAGVILTSFGLLIMVLALLLLISLKRFDDKEYESLYRDEEELEDSSYIPEDSKDADN